MRKLSDELRTAVDGCGESRYRIAQNTGINESTLSRFMQGEAISTRNADLLAEYLGLELVKVKHRKDRKKG